MSNDIAAVLKAASIQLSAQQIETPLLDAQLLLAKVLNKPSSYLYAWSEKRLSAEQLSLFKVYLKRRLNQEPLAYILGRKSFWDFDLMVTPAVLIPRPETELIIEILLNKFDSKTTLNLIDLGTGSGAIAAAIAFEYPLWRILATDYSAPSLAIAKQNFKQLSLNNIQTKQADWLQNFATFNFYAPDIIVSNPPYIQPADPHLKQDGLNFEPQQALVSAKNGLNDIEKISHQAEKILKPQGWLFLEHGYQQAEAVRQILSKNHFNNIQTWQDLAGLDRVTGAILR